MSQENVEIALQQTEALNRRDVDAFVALVSPDVEWEDSVFWSEPARIYRGRAEVREWLNRVLEPWENFHIEVEEITEVADDRVFAGGSSPPVEVSSQEGSDDAEQVVDGTVAPPETSATHRPP
jgi:ketosteroid isomerase-like protein